MTGTRTPHDTRLVSSFDGTNVAARCFGQGDATPLLLANAIGATLAAWDDALRGVALERKVVTWDHRGLYDSDPPASQRIDPGAHAEDAIAVADAIGIEDFVLASWSNGSRIALEIAARYPERTAALAVVCGGSGHSLTRLIRYLELPSLLPMVAGIAKHFTGYMQAPLRALVARPELAGLVRQSGLVGPTADVNALVELLKGLASCDLQMLLAIYEEVAGDPATDVLADVQAPTLLIAGAKDPFTPMRMMEQMERRIAQADLVVYEGATHYLPIEFPDRLGYDLRAFFSEPEGPRP